MNILNIVYNDGEPLSYERMELTLTNNEVIKFEDGCSIIDRINFYKFYRDNDTGPIVCSSSVGHYIFDSGIITKYLSYNEQTKKFLLLDCETKDENIVSSGFLMYIPKDKPYWDYDDLLNYYREYKKI